MKIKSDTLQHMILVAAGGTGLVALGIADQELSQILHGSEREPCEVVNVTPLPAVATSPDALQLARERAKAEAEKLRQERMQWFSQHSCAACGRG